MRVSRLLKGSGWLLLFLATGVALASLHAGLLTEVKELPESVVALVVAPSLTAILALPSWRIRAPDIYWKAPLLCAIALLSWLLFERFFLSFLPDDLFNSMTPLIIVLALQIGVAVFAMFAFVIRAIVARSGRWVAAGFVIVGTISGLIFIAFDVGEPWISDYILIPILQFPFLLLLSLMAHRFLPRRSLPPRIRTEIVEMS